MNETLLNNMLTKSFYHTYQLQKRRENLYQIFVPLYHEDGDMIDLFIRTDGDKLMVCDCGMTLMHLSYSFDIDTKRKQKILDNIVADAGGVNDDGNLCMSVSDNMLYESIMQFSQMVSKVSAMKMMRHENIINLFYEHFTSYMNETFKDFHPQKNFLPLPGRSELKVDYAFQTGTKPVYLFGVVGNNRAKDAIISMLSFQHDNLPFFGVVVHDDYQALSKNTQKVIMNVADKQFYDLNSFTESKDEFITRYLQ